MPVQALQCKECDSTYPLDARYVCEQCFGPLEVAYDTADSTPRRPSGRSRPAADDLALRGLPAVRGTAAPGLPVGLTPLQRAPRLAEALGRGGGVREERHRQPDPLVQGPWWRWRSRRPASSATRRGLRVHGQPGQRRGRALGGGARVVRVHPCRPRGAEGARHGRLRHEPRRRAGHLRRREPALHRDLGRARS